MACQHEVQESAQEIRDACRRGARLCSEVVAAASVRTAVAWVAAGSLPLAFQWMLQDALVGSASP